MFAFLLHPPVQQVFLETPAISKLERRYLAFAQILIEGVWGYPKILGCLAQSHYFLHSFHFLSYVVPKWRGFVRLSSMSLPCFLDIEANSHDIQKQGIFRERTSGVPRRAYEV